MPNKTIIQLVCKIISTERKQHSSWQQPYHL